MTISSRKSAQPARRRHKRPQKTLAERVAGPGQAGAKVVVAGLIGTATLAVPAATAWASAAQGNTAAPHAEPAARSTGATQRHSSSPTTATLAAVTTASSGTGPAANTQLAMGLFPKQGPAGNPIMQQPGYSDYTLPSGFQMNLPDGSSAYVTPEGVLRVASPGGTTTRDYAPGSAFEFPGGRIVVPGGQSNNDPTDQNSETKTASADGFGMARGNSDDSDGLNQESQADDAGARGQADPADNAGFQDQAESEEPAGADETTMAATPDQSVQEPDLTQSPLSSLMSPTDPTQLGTSGSEASTGFSGLSPAKALEGLPELSQLQPQQQAAQQAAQPASSGQATNGTGDAYTSGGGQPTSATGTANSGNYGGTYAYTSAAAPGTSSTAASASTAAYTGGYSATAGVSGNASYTGGVSAGYTSGGYTSAVSTS
jgi:hypothetical protein